MANLENAQFDIAYRSQSRGLITTVSPLELAKESFSSLQNVRFSRFGFGPRLGTDIKGSNANTGTTGVKSLYVYGKADGTYVIVRSHTTWFEWYDAVNDKWQTLVASLTSGLRFGLAPFNLTTLATIDNNLAFCNGTENYSEWNGAIGNIASVTASTVVLTGSTTLANLGFASSGYIVYKGTAYQYDSISGQTFTMHAGVDPSGWTVGEGIAQQADTTTHSATTKGNILLSAMGRIFSTKDSVIRITYSTAGSFTDFTAGVDYGDGGIEDIPDGDGLIMALTSRVSQGANKLIVWKRRGIYGLSFETYSGTTDTGNKRVVRSVIVEGDDAGPASPKAVIQTKYGDYFVTSRGGLQLLYQDGTIDPIISRILPSLKGFDFSDAAIGYDPNEDLVYVSCRGYYNNQTSTSNDTLIVYDKCRDAITIWRGRGYSCFAYDPSTRKMFGGDVGEARVYELNVDTKFSDDVGSGERVPIVASAITKRFDWATPAIQKKFNLYFVQGFILSSGIIKVDFRYDDGGTRKIITRTIDGSVENGYIFTKQANTFGAFQFGDLAFGAEDLDAQIENMNPFRCYLAVPIVFTYNVEVMFYSDLNVDGNGWWITADGPSVAPVAGIKKTLIIGS